jgi:hypothetical protein
MSDVNLENAILFCTGARGVYIPNHFAQAVIREQVTGVTDEQYAVLMLMDMCSEQYWDVWQEVLDNARLTKPSTGVVYVLYQDGDLWMIPQEDMQCGF